MRPPGELWRSHVWHSRHSRGARHFRAVDAWGVGCFIQEIFSGRKLTRTEELRELSRIPQVRQQRAPVAFEARLLMRHSYRPCKSIINGCLGACQPGA